MSFSGIAQIALGVAYPVLVFVMLSRFEPRFVALGVLALLLLRSIARGQRTLGPLIRTLGFPLLVLAVVIGATIVWNDPLGLLLIPTFISLSLLFAFGTSLRGDQSMIERFARLQVDWLSPEEIAYCRRVTIVWCAFFVLNGTLALGLALRDSLALWTLYTGFVSYVLIGTLFAVEYVYRHARFRRYVGGPFDSMLARVFPPLDAAPGSDSERADEENQPPRTTIDVPTELPCWPGHFDDHSVLPGVLLIDWILMRLQEPRSGPLALLGIERLKFKRPVKPGDRLMLELPPLEDASDPTAPVAFRYTRNDEVVASGRLVFAEADAVRTTDSDREPPARVARSQAGADSTISSTSPSSPSSTTWPPIGDLVPHGGAMRWIDSVLAHDTENTRCRLRARCVAPFLADPAAERIGVWWALEWMAQAVAAHDGLGRVQAEGDGTADPAASSGPRTGLLLGAKRIRFHRSWLALDAEVEIEVTHLWGGGEGLAAFDCRVVEAEGGDVVAEAQLSCFVPAPGELATLLA